MVRPVKAIKVADPTTLTRGSLPGRAKATREVNLAFRVAGPLITFPVGVGDKVYFCYSRVMENVPWSYLFLYVASNLSPTTVPL